MSKRRRQREGRLELGVVEGMVLRLMDRDAARNEANVQADVRSLLLVVLAPFHLEADDFHEVHLEAQVGDLTPSTGSYHGE